MTTTLALDGLAIEALVATGEPSPGSPAGAETAVMVRPMGKAKDSLGYCTLGELAEGAADTVRVPESAGNCPDLKTCARIGACIWLCGRGGG